MDQSALWRGLLVFRYAGFHPILPILKMQWILGIGNLTLPGYLLLNLHMVVLLGMQNYEPYDQQFCLASNQICQCDTPSKISIFVWRLLQNRLSKRDLLVSRGVIVANNDVNCVLCECEKVATTCSFLVIFPIMCGLLLTHGQGLLDRCKILLLIIFCNLQVH